MSATRHDQGYDRYMKRSETFCEEEIRATSSYLQVEVQRGDFYLRHGKTPRSSLVTQLSGAVTQWEMLARVYTIQPGKTAAASRPRRKPCYHSDQRRPGCRPHIYAHARARKTLRSSEAQDRLRRYAAAFKNCETAASTARSRVALRQISFRTGWTPRRSSKRGFV